MKAKIILFCILYISTSFSLTSYGFDLETEVKKYKKIVRPYVEKVVGKEWSDKILGVPPQGIILPSIPKVVKDTKSTEIYDKKFVDLNEKKISPEDAKSYNYSFLNEIVYAVRMRKATGDEIAKWMNVLSQGGTREGVYRALVLDNQYAGLENYDKTTNSKVKEFSRYYYKKYLGKKVKKDSLNQVNFFTLKRVTVERSLEVIDELFIRNNNDPINEDVFDWYAVFSHELASKYPKAWKNKMRKSVIKTGHKNWAKSVPRQHLKSEIIIKLHQVYNFLEHS